MVLTTLTPGETEGEFDHTVVDVRRVSRTVKGGRRFRFRASVLVGDKRGRVGFGVAKGRDVQSAITKSQTAARKLVVRVVLQRGTIPHEVRGAYGGARVLLMPAPPGAGIIAGSAIRQLAILAGVTDLSSKLLGSRNKLNVIRATLQALASLKPAVA